MNLNTYQELAHQTSRFAKYPDYRGNITMATLGLNGEAGEVADIIKKWLYHGHQLALDNLASELGDVLWYIAECCTALGITLDDIAEGNLAKLSTRYGTAFSSEASINRTD